MVDLFDKCKADQIIEELFASERNKLINYAKVILQRSGSQMIDVDGRAEDVVQELFYTAYRKIDELKNRDDLKGWLYTAVKYKVKEVLREDRQWIKCLLLVPPENLVDPPVIEELSQLMPTSDYLLLRHMYIDGYTYDELCNELGCTRSGLAMRIHRIKSRFKEKYEKYFYFE